MKRLAMQPLLGVIFVVAAVTAAYPVLLVVPLLWTGYYVGPMSDRPLAEAHKRAVFSFMKSEGFGYSRIKRSGRWNELSVQFEGASYRPEQIHLVGLTEEYGARIFEGSFAPRKNALQQAQSRELTAPELKAIEAPWFIDRFSKWIVFSYEERIG